MAPTASLLLPAPPFVSISDMRRLQFLPRGRRRPLLCWSGAGWGSVRTQMLSSFVGSRRSSRRSVICASLFGVGAPEALVIGVVALLVFGPKGLAEVARNLGKTLRAFQPTIRELQDVSREFRSTLEREIGIDEVPPSTNYRPTTTNNNEQPASDPNVKPETAPYTSEELMKVTEEQIAASAAAAWNTQPGPSQEQEAAPPTQSTDTATSGGNDGHAAPAPTTESAPSEANQSEKAPSEANQSEKARSEANQSEKARSEANKSEKVESERSKSV